MAKPGAAAAAKAAAAVEAAAAAGGLKRELRRLVMAIAGDDHGGRGGAGGGGGAGAEAFDEAERALARLRELRFGGGNGGSKGTRRREEEGGGGHAAVPEHFLCPISSEIMRDPVVLASGQLIRNGTHSFAQTYDRAFIQEWLNSGNRTCPQTQQVLSNTALTPNHLVRSMISQWCVDHGVDLPPLDSQDEGLVTRNDREEFNRLLDRISPSSAAVDKRQAIRDLRLLTKRNRSFRAVIGEKPDSISRLLSALSEIKSPEALEDIVTTILNLSIHDSNKKILGENPNVIPMLIEALYSGTMEARSNSAAALFTLSALDSNKLKIGELGAMRSLVDLLEDGTLTAKKDAASAVFNLCMAHENRARAVREGLIDVAVRSVADRTLVDELLAILALLSSDREAVEEIGEAGGVPLLLGIARENSCKRSTENAAVVLFSMCMCDRSKLREVGEDENLNGTLAWLAQNGTSRARRKAAGILEKLKKAMNMNNTHYSC